MSIAEGKKLTQSETTVNSSDGAKLTLKRETLRDLTKAEAGPGDKQQWTTCTASPPQDR